MSLKLQILLSSDNCFHCLLLGICHCYRLECMSQSSLCPKTQGIIVGTVYFLYCVHNRKKYDHARLLSNISHTLKKLAAETAQSS